MPGREKEFSYNQGVSRKEKSFSFFATQNFAPAPQTFAVEPQPSVKNPALAAENLNHLTETRFFRQNTAIVGQKSIATAKNRFYSEKIGRVAPKPGVFGSAPQTFLENRVFSTKTLYFLQNSRGFGSKLRAFLKIPVLLTLYRVLFSKISCFGQKSRALVKNLVLLTLHLVLFSKISCFWRRTSCFSLKSRAFAKIPVLLTLHRVLFSKTSCFWRRTVCFSLKSRAFEKNRVLLTLHRVLFSKISCFCQKSRAFRSVPCFIDVSGHNPFHAASIFNVDTLVQDSYLFKTSFTLPRRCKPNLNLKMNINKEQGGSIWLIATNRWKTTAWLQFSPLKIHSKSKKSGLN